MSADPDIDTALRSLPTLDAETSKADALGRLARFRLLHHTQQHQVLRLFTTVWDPVLEPVLVALVLVIYGTWGLSLVDGLFTGRR